MKNQRKRFLGMFPAIPVALVAVFLLGGCSGTDAPLPPPPPIEPQPPSPPPAAAPAPEAPAAPSAAAPARSPVAELLKMLDSDGDGRISKAEHGSHSDGMFATMDGDHDGKVTVDEMDAVRRQLYGAQRTATADEMAPVDKNHDGVLSTEEHATATGIEFDRMDTDHDGFLTASELEAANTAPPGPANPAP